MSSSIADGTCWRMTRAFVWPARTWSTESNASTWAPRSARMNGAIVEICRQQLRSVVGSLAWLSRVCRPDLAYPVKYLQSQVSQVTCGDIAFANKVVAVARNSKDKGLHYPLKASEFEPAVIIGLQDASFANDSEVNEAGKKSASEVKITDFYPTVKDNKQGILLLLYWHSTTIKRACCSTLPAETMSLLHGTEECEHVRMVMDGLRRDHHRYIPVPANWRDGF